jgi:CheY-like chemotaxis protein
MTPSRPIEVLYVEDSAGDVLITKQILGNQPVKLTVAKDGEQALTMLADEQFKPAMIILDLSLPVLSGYDVLERNPRKDIPVVVFSGSSNPADARRALDLCACEYFVKPIDLESYQVAMLGMIERWAVRDGDAATRASPLTTHRPPTPAG